MTRNLQCKIGHDEAIFALAWFFFDALHARISDHNCLGDDQPSNEHPHSEQWLLVLSGRGQAVIGEGRTSRRVSLRENSLLIIVIIIHIINNYIFIECKIPRISDICVKIIVSFFIVAFTSCGWRNERT